MRGKTSLVLANANSNLGGQTSPAANTAEDERMFQARALEREDSIGGADGPFESRVADWRRGAGASPGLRDVCEHSLERVTAERNFDPKG